MHTPVGSSVHNFHVQVAKQVFVVTVQWLWQSVFESLVICVSQNILSVFRVQRAEHFLVPCCCHDRKEDLNYVETM